MKLMKRLTLMLCICLTLSLLSCTGDRQQWANDEVQTIDPNWTAATTTVRQEIPSPEGVSAAEFVPSAQFPAVTELAVWFASSLEREQTAYAILCSQDGEGERWHCWLYAENGTAGATLTFSKDAEAEDLYLIRYAANGAATDAAGATAASVGAWYFTVTAKELPQFEVLVNEESAGVLVSYAADSVAR